MTTRPRINPLLLHREFNQLNVPDLLLAREKNHIELMRRANVVATAIGLYLIRKRDPWPPKKPPAARGKRDLTNSEVRPYSWPCILVFVKEWKPEGELSPEDIIPKALYLDDGKSVPVCVVEAQKQDVSDPMVTNVLFPSSRIGGGYPVIASTQGREHLATIGCLVTDGHTTYALTNRHVSGEPGEVLYSRMAGLPVRIGTSGSATQQLTRMRFPEVYQGWPGKSCFATLDIGLIRIDDLSDWTAQVFGIGTMGPIADLGVDNLTLRLIDTPLIAHGCGSGLMRGAIKALFYRWQSVGGFEYISDFLIASRADGDPLETRPGDSGAVWMLEHRDGPPLPLAVQWGGHVFMDATGHPQASCALATCLSTVCNLLSVEVVRDWNLGQTEYWGELGHYTIGAMACSLDYDGAPKLQTLMRNNVDRVGFPDEDLKDPSKYTKSKAGYEYVPLADVADDVWRMTRPSDGNNHFADMDAKAIKGKYKGKNLLQVCKDESNIDPDVWLEFYKGVPGTNPGALPFRVWQIYDEMVKYLDDENGADVVGFLCAAGCLAHYVGDACQPLHVSELHHGRPPLKKGSVAYKVHSVYETEMLNAHPKDLVKGIRAELKTRPAAKATFTGGDGAARRVVQLMRSTIGKLPPSKIVDAYNAEHTPADRLQRLWDDFSKLTIECMADGCVCLAEIWTSAWIEGNGGRIAASELGQAAWEDLAKLYRNKDFLPSYELAHLAKVLKLVAVA